MAETRVKKVEQGQTKIRNVPIAVTPEGFWCCPSPVMFQKTLKTQHPLNKPRSSSSPPTKTPSDHKKHSQELDKKSSSRASSKSETVVTDDQRKNGSSFGFEQQQQQPVVGAAERTTAVRPQTTENLPRKVSIEFGEAGTGDLKVVLFGKQGFIVKLSVHKSVVEENSTFFAHKLLAQHPTFHCIEIDECEDVETYVETVGLMYCKDLKQRLIKQSVSRVLRILKVAEQLGFKTCMESCLDFLEAVPWVGEEEEERVVSSVLRLQSEGIGVSPILKRVASDVSKPAKDTLSHVLQLVLKSNEEKGRREMKSIVLKLLRENNNKSGPNVSSLTSVDICNDTIYASCTTCLGSLLVLFRQVAQPEFTQQPIEVKDPVVKQMVLEADNLSWLLDILADRHAADEYAVMWASQQELAGLHPRVPIVNRHHISCITARLFVGIGRGEILSSKDTRHLLLKTWLQPLIDDYSWLQHGCKSFDRKVVEEGIGRTILTLPLEDQQIVMLGWLSSFLKAGDNCPNLQKAFEVWWRRTFVRPYTEQSNSQPLD
ncbi:putative chromatin remodeling & transcription regulator BTB-POZ family [Helianthus annuus]|uniref:BTB/POZ domain-containing protein n=1 Tax=Helianthus annuus TaxID=4232 RepID=A0A251TXK0_HELAN|nr:BTB/POZ domain-containing protein At3g50780 [Helianthus annuus]KAF5791826.1 putative BTB/POZ domain-containing protein [Helianthus annuus]KAJ0526842.1 putative chromatin remodeling & transcription regulator BTB-POZ family [Helianthus annuus]KAJ0543238.1 putative chromatin remodeling & transcription regulator BTB-POZ family [Helianthus annuus]KAJ0708295.1 putative chromatin remodeling & transcription regulator BTB-POZ family [Helianthus annuus]KAJ0712241.1 putative chromatin remodeling & tra